VLLVGETGTGKEIFARAIHKLSTRSESPFVAVNCAALPLGLIESELFGHVRGAFSGADRNREGRFESVSSGTLLLDEVGDLDLAVQIKILRVIEQRQFERVGHNDPQTFAGRLISATSIDLQEACHVGKFRMDLLGRLNQIKIALPPLRKRSADIPLLVRHFLKKHSSNKLMDLSPSALYLLMDSPYPMNVRQLENAVISAIAHCGPSCLILPAHLPEEIRSTQNVDRSDDLIIRLPARHIYGEARTAAECQVDSLYLGQLLKKHNGNQSTAAAEAGIDRKTFAARLEKANQWRRG
jgi:DNA-binding NtrC family response regulator